MTLQFGCTIKRTIVTNDGKDIGTLAGCIVEEDGWTVSHLLAELSKSGGELLGQKGSMLKSASIGIKTEAIGNIGDMIMLKVSSEEIKDHIDQVKAEKKSIL
jgi:sporulation protein YlmC with PRC-barrel domain